jgi:hypothetical protein
MSAARIFVAIMVFLWAYQHIRVPSEAFQELDANYKQIKSVASSLFRLKLPSLKAV